MAEVAFKLLDVRLQSNLHIVWFPYVAFLANAMHYALSL